MIWVFQFFIYINFLTVSGAVCDWYFSRRDQNDKKIRGDEDDQLSRNPVCGSCCRAWRYHLGTVAFGACLIAIISTLRWCVRYVESLTASKSNACKKCVYCCVHCCLCICECILDRISKNALIFTALYGDPFCPAAIGSFKLVWNNLARVAAVSLVSAYVVILCKLAISAGTVGICGLVLIYAEPYKTDMSSPIFTLICIFIIAYVVASFFMTTYNTAIDTIFLCFIADEQTNGVENSFADQNLKDIINKHADKSAKIAGKWNPEGPQQEPQVV